MPESALPWAERSNTIGFVPGKKKDRRDALRRILQQLPARSGSTIVVRSAAGLDEDRKVDDVCGAQLSRGALVKRDSDGVWFVTQPVSEWLESQDDLKLAKYLHGAVKLFGELLNSLERVRSKEDILAVAHEFGLAWTSTDQLYRRVAWFEVLGLVERWDTNRLVITDLGKEFLEQVRLTSPEEVNGIGSSDSHSVSELPAPNSLVLNLISKRSRERKVIVGYIPRGAKARDRDSSSNSSSPMEAIRTLLAMVGEGVEVGQFHKLCLDRLGLKKTSATQTMHTMRQMGVMDMIAYGQYGPMADVAELTQPGNEIDFVRYLHSRYFFVGEILTLVDDPTPVPEVARLAHEKYGLNRLDNGEVRTRMGFLADAGLVERIDWTRYRVSPLGRALVDELEIDSPGPVDLQDPVEASVNEPHFPGVQVAQLISDLRAFGNNGERSEEFEVTVTDCFAFLGFRAHHVGGSGRTDIVVDAGLPAGDSYRVIIDTKASSSGLIAENAIRFDALKDHQKRHRADFGVVVGPEFGGRVREWATNNRFALLTIDDLVGILERHSVNPVSIIDLRIMFQAGDDSLAEVDQLYSEAARSSELLEKIVSLLHDEALEEDPILEGSISLENINYALRKEMSPRPSQASVEECLQILSHELVRGAVKNGNKYKLADAPINIRRRLASLGANLGSE